MVGVRRFQLRRRVAERIAVRSLVVCVRHGRGICTGLHVVRVDVHVQSVSFEQDKKALQAGAQQAALVAGEAAETAKLPETKPEPAHKEKAKKPAESKAETRTKQKAEPKAKAKAEPKPEKADQPAKAEKAPEDAGEKN